MTILKFGHSVENVEFRHLPHLTFRVMKILKKNSSPAKKCPSPFLDILNSESIVVDNNSIATIVICIMLILQAYPRSRDKTTQSTASTPSRCYYSWSPLRSFWRTLRVFLGPSWLFMDHLRSSGVPWGPLGSLVGLLWVPCGSLWVPWGPLGSLGVISRTL